MAKLLVMPKLGLTMVEGKVSKWHKKEGDEVKKGDVLFEVETDKITNHVEADQDGVIRKVFVDEGAKAPVAAPVAILAGKDEDISNLLNQVGANVEELLVKSSEKAETLTKKESSIDRKLGEYIRATPYAKYLAKENSIDLSNVIGTGEGGRIVSRDVLDYIEKTKVKISPVAAKMAKEMDIDITTIDAKGRIMKEDILAAVNMNELEAVEDKVEKVTPSTMRNIIAERMLESWTTTPRVTYNMEVDMTNIIDFRNKLKDSFAKVGAKLTYNHILMKIASKVLLEYPYLNASFNGEVIELHNYVNIGLAVDVGDGLLVPNVKNVQDKSLLDIALETETMIRNAREGGLSPDDLTGGTFTITNIGMFGIDSFSPIINKPEVAILGVNRIIEKPIVANGQIVIRPMMNLSLSADHRLVDGAMAAKFLARFKEILENPYLLLV